MTSGFQTSTCWSATSNCGGMMPTTVRRTPLTSTCDPIALGRPPHDGVHDGEDRGVRAYSKRKRQDRDEREPWRPHQVARGVANVSKQAVHQSPSYDTGPRG